MHQERSSAAQKLAGKRATEPVMRDVTNGGTTRYEGDHTRKTAGNPQLDTCSRGTTLVQKMHSLDLANEVRCGRAQCKRDLRAGTVEFDAFLDEMPAVCTGVPIGKLLTWLPKVGRTRAKGILAVLNISPELLVGALSARQKYALYDRVRPYLTAHERWKEAVTA